MNLASNPLVVGFVAFLVGAGLMYLHMRAHRAVLDTLPPEPAVDPWALQRELMERSDQRLPAVPRLHNGVVLYAALNLEELGEMCESIANALTHYECIAVPGVAAMSASFLTHGRAMVKRSHEIRDFLKRVDIGSHQLLPRDARALFDDTTDLMVTNVGFTLSCGFPGPAGYAEAQNSNLSKANPETGKIDKTADGKWIKGPRYFEPDLVRVLSHHAPVWGMRQGLVPGVSHGGVWSFSSGADHMKLK